MQYILASASPRRQELLKEIIAEFEVIPSTFDENGVKSPSIARLVKRLAEGKAKEVACRTENAGKIVVGSDTVVAYGRQVLGKPQDQADAVRMLSLLSGKKHYVYTGVCFCQCTDGAVKAYTKYAKTAVYFEKLTEEQIKAYVATGSPMDKAGAYGIQDGGLVKKIKGSYSCVVGLPVELVKKMSRKITEKGLDI